MIAARRTALGAVFPVLAALALLALLLLAPGQAAAASYRVAMQGYAFAPASLTVRVGDSVTWANGDTAPHDVKTTSGPVAIHSPMLSKGQSWTYTFTAAGSYAYYCTVHPDMTARITVLPKPTPTPTPTSHHEAGTSHGAVPTPTRTAPATRTARGATSSATPSKPTSSAVQAAPSPSPSTSVAAAAPQTEPAAAARPLQPLLLLTGVVSGVAVLCLLLVGSRAATARGED
ncbi:plastocyanin/azurin family copper-binding protein [Streptomyces sp. S.PB5]|uniref:cupredoxin domain-containing protein n=1 Tax=Streptomyces sp. S.PB5 TaxID=3020844 RepID=UPI0025AF0C87|nr:plastocyanin/azurin family copper-binding protein [Streptomyces sp. S.PB5]MDN3023028.1 plastocyanin/azurin family copper-binding protein [Streptomyces sp. S.PB5]